MNLFGFEFSRKEKPKQELNTFQMDRDASTDMIVPNAYAAGGLSSYNLFGYLTVDDERTAIENYRILAASSEVDEALQEIRNEIYIFDVPGKKAVQLQVNDKFGISRSVAKKIVEEFDNVYEAIEFDHLGIQYFDDWYVDGKLYAYKIIDQKNPRQGIQKIQVIDPLKIRRVKILPEQNPDGTYDQNKVKELFVYSDFDHNKYKYGQTITLNYGQQITGLQIRPEAMTYVHSGNWDRAAGRYVGYLNKAVLPFNNLKMMEDSMVIFRVARAPSRRAIYVDVAGLQGKKAEEYVKSMMERYRNRITYDSKTGSLSDRRNVLSMLEDYWLPRRSEGRTTEIQNLEGQGTSDILEEVEYNRDKLWRALNVPRGRFGEQNNTFVFGKGTEIQRDEYRFKRFLNTLRSRFALFFEDLLKTQLLLKRIITESDWEAVRKSLEWTYTEDNAFVEYKESEIMRNRLDNLAACENIIGKFRSLEWAAKNILKMTDEEIAEERLKIKKEQAADPQAHDVDFDSGDKGWAPPASGAREEPEQEDKPDV